MDEQKTPLILSSSFMTKDVVDFQELWSNINNQFESDCWMQLASKLTFLKEVRLFLPSLSRKAAATDVVSTFHLKLAKGTAQLSDFLGPERERDVGKSSGAFL